MYEQATRTNIYVIDQNVYYMEFEENWSKMPQAALKKNEKWKE